MILEINPKLFVESVGRTWTITGTGGVVNGLSNLRGVADTLVSRRHLPAYEAQRYPNVIAHANELSGAINERLSAVRDSLSFAAGGFTITRGNGDFILTNPTLETARLPGDRDSQNRKSVVGYYASTAAALIASVERSLAVCNATLPYARLNELAAGVASRLWADLGLENPIGRGEAVDLTRHDDLSGSANRGNGDNEGTTRPPSQVRPIARITCLPLTTGFVTSEVPEN